MINLMDMNIFYYKNWYLLCLVLEHMTWILRSLPRSSGNLLNLNSVQVKEGGKYEEKDYFQGVYVNKSKCIYTSTCDLYILQISKNVLKLITILLVIQPGYKTISHFLVFFRMFILNTDRTKNSQHYSASRDFSTNVEKLPNSID